MILDESLDAEKSRWDSRVLATDLSEKVLREGGERRLHRGARRAAPRPLEAEVPDAPAGRQLRDGGGASKKEVIFRRFNLIEPSYPFKKKFHVIFCRNVMIYFDAETRASIINKLYEVTEPGGYLLHRPLGGDRSQQIQIHVRHAGGLPQEM